MPSIQRPRFLARLFLRSKHRNGHCATAHACTRNSEAWPGPVLRQRAAFFVGNVRLNAHQEPQLFPDGWNAPRSYTRSTRNLPFCPIHHRLLAPKIPHVNIVCVSHCRLVKRLHKTHSICLNVSPKTAEGVLRPVHGSPAWS